MERIKKIILNRFYFLIAFLVSSLIFTIPSLLDYQKYNKIFLVWGSILIIHDFFGKKTIFFNIGRSFLWILTAGYICTLLFAANGFAVSDWSRFAYLFLHMFIMNSYECNDDANKINKRIMIFCNMYIIPIFVMIVSSVIMFFIGTEITYTTTFGGNSVTYTMGIYQGNRLQGVFSNPNELGVASLISIILSFLCIFITTNKVLKRFYFLNSVLAYITLSWSMSRTTALLLLCYAFGTHFIMKVCEEKHITIKKICKTLVLSLGVSIFVWIGIIGIVKIGNGIMTVRQIMIDKYSYEMENDEQDYTNVKLERSGNEDAGNGRILLWKYGIEVWETSPIFGVGFLKGKDKAIELGYNSVYLKITGGFHNAYIEVLAGFGLIGIVSFLGYFVSIFVKIVNLLFCNRINNKIFLMLIITVLVFLGYGIFEYIIICPGNFVAVPFWGILGFLNYYLWSEKKHS